MTEIERLENENEKLKKQNAKLIMQLKLHKELIDKQKNVLEKTKEAYLKLKIENEQKDIMVHNMEDKLKDLVEKQAKFEKEAKKEIAEGQAKIDRYFSTRN